MARSQIVLVAILLLVGGLVFKIEPYLHIFNVEVGDRAPGFHLAAAESGVGVRLEDYEGKYVLLNLWATWGLPCVDELPSLIALQNALQDNGLVVVGVSVDENQEAYQGFLDSFGVNFPTARDPERTVSTRYGTQKYTETNLIGPYRVVARKYIGAENWMRPEVVNHLRSLL